MLSNLASVKLSNFGFVTIHCQHQNTCNTEVIIKVQLIFVMQTQVLISNKTGKEWYSIKVLIKTSAKEEFRKITKMSCGKNDKWDDKINYRKNLHRNGFQLKKDEIEYKCYKVIAKTQTVLGNPCFTSRIKYLQNNT
jgi:hypothetical protein